MASRALKVRPSIKKKHPIYGVMAVTAVFFSVMFASYLGLYTLCNNWVKDLDSYDVATVSELNSSAPTTVYASDGTTQLARFQVENREPVESSAICTQVKNATVAVEDERFYEHGGFDPVGIARAAVVSVSGSGREGASTITQQFVRNTILSEEMNEISIKRKIREIYLAIKIEQQYSKDEILLMYLNTVNYGSGAYGIQAASQRYFSKNASDLTLAESATLAGIPQSPTYNNPIDHLDTCTTRRNAVLDRMLKNGYITQTEHDSAVAEPVVLNPSTPTIDGIEKYPYFTSYVKNYLTDKYSQLDIFKGGLTVVTTLDVSTQDYAEAAVANKESGLSDAISGSLVATDPSTGHIKALVGGKDWETQKTNLATGEGTSGGRPCGSAFKTFTLVTSLEEKISPSTTVDCSSPATITDTEYTGNNALKNIDNINYGTRTIARAFAVSSNTGFVRLQMAMGTQKVIDTAKKMGITSTLEANPSLTLGQSNVTMLDMSNAYAVIANGGKKYDATPILKIYDKSDTLIVDNTNPTGEQVISPEVAHAATEVMKTVVNTSEGTGYEAKLSSGQEVAAKTGTSSSYQDITFCGITPQLSVAIWFGDPSNQETLPSHLSAADVFANFMNDYLTGKETRSFPDAGDPEYSPFSNNTYHVYATTQGYSSSSSSNSYNNGYNSNSYNYGYSYGNSSSSSSNSYSYNNSSSNSNSSSTNTGTGGTNTGTGAGTSTNTGTGTGASTGTNSAGGGGGGSGGATGTGSTNQ